MGRDFPELIVPPRNRPMPLEVFVVKYLSHHLRDSRGTPIPIPDFHREAYSVLSQPDLYPKFMYISPRGFSKSTKIMLFDTLYDVLVTRRFEEILLITSTQFLIRKWMRTIKRELTQNELILRDFGDVSTEGMRGEKWTEDVLTTKTGITVYGIGKEGASRGMHPGKVSIDDIEDDESARSKVQCEKTETWLKSTLEPMLIEKDVVMRWCGTLLTPTSVLYKASKGDGWDDSWYRRIYSAIDDEDKAIWPERFSLEWLENKRHAIGALNFQAEYMNKPEFGGNPVVRREWISYYGAEQLPPFMFKVMAIDPAISEKDSADETSIVVAGADISPERAKNTIYVIDCDKGRWDINSQVRRIYEMYRAYKPDCLVIEGIAYQRALKTVLLREARDWGLFIPINVITSLDKDKRRRLIEVSSLIESGDVLFRKSAEQEELILQLLSFPMAAHDDHVDALVYALDKLKHHWMFVSQQQESFSGPQLDPPAIPEIGF